MRASMSADGTFIWIQDLVGMAEITVGIHSCTLYQMWKPLLRGPPGGDQNAFNEWRGDSDKPCSELETADIHVQPMSWLSHYMCCKRK